MSESSCPFCFPPAERLFHIGKLVLGLWDAYPVSDGHALLVPKRHVATWFDATLEEQAELNAAIAIARSTILEKYKPDGFNIGVNVGEAAGQTVFHLHVHVIPRYRGDVPNPRGGVRHVIPHRGDYFALASTACGEPPGGEGSVREAPTPAYGGRVVSADSDRGTPHGRPLITGESDPLLPHLLAHLDAATRVDVAVAFVQPAGVARSSTGS